MCYVEIKIDKSGSFPILLIKVQIFSRDSRSRFAVGSSRMMNFASPMRAIARESFLRVPGERNFTSLSCSLEVNCTLFAFKLK